MKVLGVGAGALTIGIGYRACDEQRRVAGPADVEGAFRPNAFVTITPDDRILFALNKAEMGQGIITGYAMLIAEELAVPLARVQTHFADGAPEFRTSDGMQLTASSTSMRQGFVPVRQAAAAARVMLIAAAAERWGVEPSACEVANGQVRHVASGQQASYGELAGSAADQPVPDEPPLTSDTAPRLIGSSPQRVDIRAKVDGSVVYGMDVTVPGMVRALVLHPPRFGAVATEVQADEARAMPGVIDVVSFPRGVAILAEKYWQALRARPHVEVAWSDGPIAQFSTTTLRAQLAQQEAEAKQTHRDEGDVEAALAGDVSVVEAVYETPYLAHAPMEPQNCVADVREDYVEIWVPTQSPTVVQEAAAAVVGLERNDVIVHTTFLGGGFGRRVVPDAVVEAVTLSQLVGRPVQVIWSRESDTRQGHYRPLSRSSMRAAINTDGQPIALAYHSWSSPILADQAGLFAAIGPDWMPPSVRRVLGKQGAKLVASDLVGGDPLGTEGVKETPYMFDNIRVEYSPIRAPISVAFWRSVGHSFNAFVIESFIDEIAHASERDPYELRMALLPAGSRERAVLEALAVLGGWGEPAAPGFAKGLAVHASFGSYCGQLVEAGVIEDRIVVRRVACVIDCGLAVHPDLVTAQIEGGIIFGLSAALWQQITIEGGEVQQGNFDSYRVLRMHECPQIQVEIASSDHPPTGVGEVGVPPIAPALANAIFAATGVRLRDMPLQAAWDQRDRGAS
ncbi:xanthine dehydrogenase family protein molybdopterin-binding subunit [Enhygromyxa salina]|uniref:xanthine dehydrogenase family protein molybdopterin-binding subunit n=1 Tax=Enhygromyxa salina TaxID=215803 RepID=UPI0006971104|nr:molybdopterin cofactor-binding domain-containing protein [Enhygromyxa salina]